MSVNCSNCYGKKFITQEFAEAHADEVHED